MPKCSCIFELITYSNDFHPYIKNLGTPLDTSHANSVSASPTVFYRTNFLVESTIFGLCPQMNVNIFPPNFKLLAPFLAYGFAHPPRFRPIHFTNKPSEAFGLRITLIYFSLTYLLKDTVNKHICISHICIRFVRKRCKIEKIWYYKFVYHSIINIHLSAVILVNFFCYYSKMKGEKYNRKVCSWT